MVVLVNERIV
jgi:hypothetical protein